MHELGNGGNKFALFKLILSRNCVPSEINSRKAIPPSARIKALGSFKAISLKPAYSPDKRIAITKELHPFEGSDTYPILCE